MDIVAIIKAVVAIRTDQWLLWAGIILCTLSVVTGIPWLDVQDAMREKALITGLVLIVLGIALLVGKYFVESRKTPTCRRDHDSE